MRGRLATITCCVVLGAGIGIAAAPGAVASTAPAAGATVSTTAVSSGAQTAAHGDPGRPINSKRCRRLLRKIDRFDRKAKRLHDKGKGRKARKFERKRNRKARKYNRTCRR